MERRRHGDARLREPARDLGVAVVGSARVVATRCIPRCHHGLLSHRARSFRDEADVCPRRMRTKGERCPSPSSASSSWRFRTAELFPAERRPDNLDLSHLLGRSVSCGGAEPLGSILTHTPVLWTNAQQSLLTAGLATPRRDRCALQRSADAEQSRNGTCVLGTPVKRGLWV